jgi:Uma2 family endonuclease
VPDVAVYRWERITRTPGGRVANRFTEPPDIAIEILSPDQSRRELHQKCLGLVARGVRAALLVDADRDAVTLFRPGQDPGTLREAEAIDLDDIIPGLRLTVEAVLGALRID